MLKRLEKTIRYSIPLAVVITLLCGLLYATVQQNFRQNANDPQIQIAEDTASVLNGGLNVKDVVPDDQIDVSASLSPFLIVFDKNGKVASSDAVLDGKIPTPPPGVLDYVASGGETNFGSLKKRIIFKIEGGSEENRITWEPKDGVRLAAVITKYDNGFVLVGRNLREVEIREDNLTHMIFAGWFATMGATFTAAFLFL